MSKRVWQELWFVLSKSDGTTLTLGKDKYKIQNDESLFRDLITYSDGIESREFTIICYLGDTKADSRNIAEFADFFEVSGKSEEYGLKIYFDNLVYNATVKSDDKPLKLNDIENLYGSALATVEIPLIMEDPFFYSDLAYSKNIGAQFVDNYSYPLPYRLGDGKKFYLGQVIPLSPHDVNNVGSENNGVLLTIKNSNRLINPKLENQTTGLSMGLTLDIEPGSTLEIDTVSKTVYLNDVYMANAKNLFDKWLYLIKGSNSVLFTADSGADTSQIELKYYDKYRSLVQFRGYS